MLIPHHTPGRLLIFQLNLFFPVRFFFFFKNWPNNQEFFQLVFSSKNLQSFWAILNYFLSFRKNKTTFYDLKFFAHLIHIEPSYSICTGTSRILKVSRHWSTRIHIWDPPWSTTWIILELLPQSIRIHHVDPPGAINIYQDMTLGSIEIHKWDHPGTAKWVNQELPH